MRPYFAALLLAFPAFSQVTITPSSPGVMQGQSLVFTSSAPVTWSLSPGSAGMLASAGPTSVTYLAPQLIHPQGVAAGCQTTPSDSVFNTRIDNLPIEAHSAQWTTAMSPVGLSIQPDFGINLVDASTPIQSERFVYTPQNNGVFPRSPLATQKAQGGSYQSDLSAGSSDRHILYADPRSCTFWEAYKQFSGPRTGPTYCRGTGTCTAMSGIAYNWSSYALPTGSTQASNLLYLPTMIHADEIHQGLIPHALEFTDSLGSIKGGTPYWPANSILGCLASVCPNSPPYGARFRLKASVDISHFTQNAQVVLRALQQYGMFLSDVGTGGAVIYADTDTTQDQAVNNAFGEVGNAHLTMSSFDVVDESSFIVNTRSMQVNPANPYQAPTNYAVITATPAIGSPVSVPIALRAQAPATASSLFIIAGTPGYSLPGWVGGTSNPMLMWKLISGVGTVTNAGIYTPPASVAAPTKAFLQLVPCSSPGVFAQTTVTVLPSSADGAIRIDAGNSTPTISGTKHWLADTAFEGAIDRFRGDYPKWLNQADPDINIYQTFHYTQTADLTYSLIVPNGNYKARLMFGAPYNGLKCTAPCVYNPLVSNTSWGPYNLIANGQIAAHNYDFGIATGHIVAATSDTYLPLAVTNNQLTLSIRGNRPDAPPGLQQIMPVLEGLEIVPDTSAPYLTIDPQQQSTVAGGSSLQLYAIGWYMDNSVQWNIVSGPGSIDQTGRYTAPAATDSVQTVTIQATSLVNGHVSATVTLTIQAA